MHEGSVFSNGWSLLSLSILKPGELRIQLFLLKNSPGNALICQNQEGVVHVMANFIKYSEATTSTFAIAVVELLAISGFTAE
jgi:hypothetical protein